MKSYKFLLIFCRENVIKPDSAFMIIYNYFQLLYAVFCLSLMGTNLKDFLLEANPVLKIGLVLN